MMQSFNPDLFEPTHRTPQGLVRAKRWHKAEDHPAVRPLEEIDRRRLRRLNLPAYEAHTRGELQVGFLDSADTFVFPGQWVYQDERGDLHLRDDETHNALAIPLPNQPDEPTPLHEHPETDRPRRAGSVERPTEGLTDQQSKGDAFTEGKEP